MDFFEAQARAKKRTTRLVVLFVLAVLGIVGAGYFTTIAALRQTGGAPRPASRYQARLEFDPSLDAPAQPWWDPRIFTIVSLGTVAVVGLASLFKWSQLRAGGRAIAEMVGGRRVEPHTTDLKERQLLNIVEEMSIASGTPMPAVYVLDDESAINAFAAGLTTSDAVVVITRGTLEKLTRDELQGMIAHDFSHILNGDMRLNVKLTAIVFGILVIGLIGRGILFSLRHTRMRSSGNNKNGGGVIAAIVAVGVVLFVLGYIGYFFGRLIQAAVSRQREFLADASAVQFTRNPVGIGGALKKIGGFALGSRLQSSKCAEIGHLFFAQAAGASFAGMLATHPSLGERIRAIEPAFDGKFIEPPEVVDVSRATWSETRTAAGLAPVAPIAPRPRAVAPYSTNLASAPATPPPLPALLAASIGQLESAHIDSAQQLLSQIPDALREATRTPDGAAALVCGLLLDAQPELRQRQIDLVASHAGESLSEQVATLSTPLRALAPEARLPLLLLTLPALRQLAPATLSRVLGTLDELVHADSRVSIFEFSLQKVLVHHLRLGATPAAPGTQIQSFQALEAEIALTLSFLAYASASEPAAVTRAFAAGAQQLKLLEGRLALRPVEECRFERLDAALDRLALAAPPIKQRLLTACTHVVASDGQARVNELELLRAFASALDCPMPPISAAA